LSPLLFIIYDEAMVKEATAKEELGVKVGGEVATLCNNVIMVLQSIWLNLSLGSAVWMVLLRSITIAYLSSGVTLMSVNHSRMTVKR